MKIKVIKYPGYYKLVCNEQSINEKHNCSQEDPITLATMSTWEMSKCWKLRDMRLEDVFHPSPYLEGSNLQKYMPVDEDDAQNLKSQLRYYKETPEGEIKWGTFVGIVGMGDKTDHPDNLSWIAQSIEGCWSFNAAREKFKEIKEFWKSFEGNDLKNAMMENPNKQISEFDYKFQKGEYSSPTKKHKMK